MSCPSCGFRFQYALRKENRIPAGSSGCNACAAEHDAVLERSSTLDDGARSHFEESCPPGVIRENRLSTDVERQRRRFERWIEQDTLDEYPPVQLEETAWIADISPCESVLPAGGVETRDRSRSVGDVIDVRSGQASTGVTDPAATVAVALSGVSVRQVTSTLPEAAGRVTRNDTSVDETAPATPASATSAPTSTSTAPT